MTPTSIAQQLEKRHRVRFLRCTELDRLDPCLEQLFDLHQKLWGRRGQPGSFAGRRRRDFYRALGRELLGTGQLELWLLELDGTAAAAQLGFRFRQTAYALQEGFDPDPQAESVGYQLRAHVLRELIESSRWLAEHSRDWLREHLPVRLLERLRALRGR